jgi:hypothetical protein
MYRHYRCVTCKRDYNEYQLKYLKGQAICSEGHPVKLIPWTSDECPLCHEQHFYRSDGTGKPVAFRDINRVCDSCWKEWNRLKEFETITRKKQAGMLLFPYVIYPRFWAGCNPDPHAEGDRLAKAWLTLIEVVSLPPKKKAREAKFTIGHSPSRSDGWRGPQTSKAMFRQDMAVALQRLWLRIVQYARACNVRGREDGGNILLSLAAGDVTVKEFNKVTAYGWHAEEGDE